MWRSLYRPWVALTDEDVWDCDECEGKGDIYWHDGMDRQCPACEGSGKIHGFASSGQPQPARWVPDPAAVATVLAFCSVAVAALAQVAK